MFTTFQSIFLLMTSFSTSKAFFLVPAETTCDTSECVIAAGRMLTNMNRSADPCIDFHEYACGNYRMMEEIPAGQFGMSPFNKAHLLKQKRLRALLFQSLPSKNSSTAEEPSPRQKIRDYYLACNNVTAIEINGIVKLREIVSDLGGLILKPLTKNGSNESDSEFFRDWSLERLLEKRNRYSISGLFGLGVGPDDKNALTNIIQIDQGGLGLGTRDFYINISVTKDTTIKGYTLLMQSYASVIVGAENVTKSCLVDVIEFEQQLALIQSAKDQRRDVMQLYNKFNVSWLNKNADFLNWTSFFNSLFNPVNITIDEKEPVLVYATSFLKKLTGIMHEYLFSDTGKQVIHNYIVLSTIAEYAPSFGSVFRDAKDALESSQGGKSGRTEQWLSCLDDFETEIGYPLSAMFVEKHFGLQNKAFTENIVRDIIPAFRKRMSKAEWMVGQDKKVALEKLDSMNFNVAFPDWLFNDSYMDEFYRDFTVTNDYTTNVLTSFRYLQERSLKDLRKPVDASRWKLTPHTVNAYYDPSHNKFIIPAGILVEPFVHFSEEAPLALNYGAVGSVTAHEIVHSVDDQGRQYDKHGSLRDWWQNETVANFNNLTKCLINQYDHYRVNNMNVRGLQTLGENIADNGGVKTSFEAFKIARRINRKAKAKLVGVNATAEQLFFIAYAQVWCSVAPDSIVRLGILVDNHAPNPARVNGPLSNFPAFAEAFSCKPKTPMNPTNKCSVW